MSTQYGTLSHRKTVEVPMWLIVALVVGTAAIGIGYTLERQQTRGTVETSTVKAYPDTQVAAREGGTVIMPATTGTVFPGGLETAGVIPQVPAAVFPGGLETSGVFPSTGTGNTFPDSQVVAREGPSQPIVVNGRICHQCL